MDLLHSIDSTKDHNQVLKAKIEFELNDDQLSKDQLKMKLIEHIYEMMDLWIKGESVITIEFEIKKNEIFKQHNIFIH